jgi:elongation factor P
MLTPTDLRAGTTVYLEGVPHIVVAYEHQKYGRGSATVRVKFKNLKTGSIFDRTFSGKERLEEADVDYAPAQFLYAKDNILSFMDQTNFETIEIPLTSGSDVKSYLKEREKYDLITIDGKPSSVKLPPKVDLRVTETEPGVRGDTAQSPTKKATLETGLVIQVPLFVKVGDMLRINTESGQYVERV